MAEGEEKGLITRGRYELKFRGTECLNCGHLLDMSDKYCPSCSQANSIKKLTLKDFFDEFLSNLVNYDSKLLATLYAMLIKPGTITKDYIKGRRISYTNPFRFLLTLAFLYFLMVSYGGAFSSIDDLKLDEKMRQTGPLSFSFDDDKTAEEIKNDSIKVEEGLDNLFSSLDSIKTNNPEIDNNISGLDSLGYYIKQGEQKKRKNDSLMDANPRAYYKKIQADSDSGLLSKMKFFFLMIRRDSISSYADAKAKYDIDDSWNTKLAFNASKSSLRAWRQPGTWLNDTISKLPFVIFFFLPIFTIFIYVVYIRKKYTYTDHLIFSFHNQSLLFILLILSWVIDSIFDWSTSGIFLLIFGIYLFQAMRKFYGQGFFKTSIKYLFLNTVFTFLAIITVLLLGIGSVFTY
jgi:hypothetical protein